MREFAFIELIHAYLCGPMSTETFGGSRYLLLITDDFSQMSWVYFLKYKSEVFENFRKYKALVENESGLRKKIIRTDRGGELFVHFCKEYGIHRELTSA